MDIAVVGVGISVTLENNEFKSVRVALAAVAPTPLFVTEAGDALSGKAVNDKSIELAGDIARNAAKPINDMRGTIEYRKHLCSVLTKRALTTAIERANGGTVNGH
jgi:carbon-monoxide dehydrogenase medium subunit